jgi:hypothetical protein
MQKGIAIVIQLLGFGSGVHDDAGRLSYNLMAHGRFRDLRNGRPWLAHRAILSILFWDPPSNCVASMRSPYSDHLEPDLKLSGLNARILTGGMFSLQVLISPLDVMAVD